MSSFFDESSLCLIPSGYKNGKIYSVKPTDGSGDLTFTRASNATRVNASGLIETVASGLPRLDYLGSTCGKLMLEPQRTNQILQSEALGSASWTAFNASVSSNVTATLDPQGTNNADKLIEDSSSAFHDADQVQTYTAAAYTISVFAKAAGRNHIFLQHFDGSTFFTSGTFNLANGTVSGSGSIVSYGNGWYRCSFTATTVSGTGKAYINLSNGTTGNYQGDGTSGVYLWGCQVEAGAYATSYIPTTSAAVTRVADAASKTGISSLIGQTEGTLFAELEVINGIDNFGIWLRLSGSLYLNTIIIYTNASRVPTAEVNVAGSQVVLITGAALSVGYHKLAFAYKGNDFAFYVDGVQAGTDTSGTVPTCDEIYIDQYIDGGSRNATKKQALLFKTRLPNSDLATLTSL